jgi:hypothetical protein
MHIKYKARKGETSNPPPSPLKNKQIKTEKVMYTATKYEKYSFRTLSIPFSQKMPKLPTLFLYETRIWRDCGHTG